MADFIKAHYLDTHLDLFSNHAYRERWAADGGSVELEWELAQPKSQGGSAAPSAEAVTAATASSTGIITHLTIGPDSISITFDGLQVAQQAARLDCTRMADDLEALASSFLAHAKTTSLYFVFSVEEHGVAGVAHAPAPSVASNVLKRVMSGNMLNLYLVILVISFGLFFLLGNYAFFAMILIQVVALFYSDRLAFMLGKVHPTAEEPRVALVCVPVSPETRELIAKHASRLVSEMSDRLEAGVSKGELEGSGAKEAVQSVLATFGIVTKPEEIKIVTRNVHGLVKEVAGRFALPVPKITIVNNVADNAAATGVSPRRSSITITAGSLEDLGDAELSSVIGHELGHIRGRDSVILFCVTFLLYFVGLFLLLPLVPDLWIFDYIIIFALVFAVGKVLETRADTESAAKLGDPEALASALTKIGFRQLYYERYSAGARRLDWLRFDPHPPIYFRVQRLSRFAVGGARMGNTFLISLRDCLSGFLHALA